MFLSRVEIDSKNRQKISNLTHLGAYHDWVERAFPDEINDGVRKRHLWRIDQLGAHQYLLVLSEDKPDLVQLEKNGIKGSAETKDYDHYLSEIIEGSKWRFRLTANPTHRIDDAGKSRVVPHITIEQQMNWLLERANKNGFKFIEDEQYENQDYIKFNRPLTELNYENAELDKSVDGSMSFRIVQRDWPILYRKNRKNGIKLSRVTFEGILEVVDANKFKNVLITGIGREKAYGMGMLTVIPFKD